MNCTKRPCSHPTDGPDSTVTGSYYGYGLRRPGPNPDIVVTRNISIKQKELPHTTNIKATTYSGTILTSISCPFIPHSSLLCRSYISACSGYQHCLRVWPCIVFRLPLKAAYCPTRSTFVIREKPSVLIQ